MKRYLIISCVVILFTFVLQVAVASGQQVGDQIVLKATNALGVPMHAKPNGPSPFERIPDGAVVTVLATTSDGRWLHIQLPDGRNGWVTKTYVKQILAPATNPTPVPPAVLAAAKVWGSPAGCRQVVNAGGRMPSRQPGAIRLATWNIRWFAKGCSPGETCDEKATDIHWLACTIAWMDLDLLGVQEILNDALAVDQMEQLIVDLNHLTGGDWQRDLQQCGPPKSQHVGFLWNSAAITLTNFADVAQLNGAFDGANACAGNLRPGRYAHAQTPGGADFHIVTVHLDSGTANRDYQHRRSAARQIPWLTLNGAPLLASDKDLLVIGDFNTMGRDEQPTIKASQEIRLLDQELEPAFRRMSLAPVCTEYFDNHPGILDQIVVTNAMREAARSAQVSGYCAVKNCVPLAGAAPLAFEHLSDHCPVVFEVQDKNLDN